MDHNEACRLKISIFDRDGFTFKEYTYKEYVTHDALVGGGMGGGCSGWLWDLTPFSGNTDW